MNCLSSRVSAVGIFFAATALLILYLLSIRYHIYLPVTLFWVAIALMLGTITYQCLRIKLSSGYVKVVLLEIAVTCLVLHLIYQIPYYGLYGSDAYFDMASAKSILSSGFIMGDPQYINDTSPWPMIHILGAQLSLITGLELFTVVKWFPSLMDVALVVLLYLLVRRIFEDEKVALLSTLLFTCLQHHILFSSLFIRETIALVLMICCLYLYFSVRSSAHPATCYALSITCLVATTLAHHFTSLMLLVFLLIHFLLTKASKLSALKRAYFGSGITGEKAGITFLLLALLLPLAYWISGGIQARALRVTTSAMEPIRNLGSFANVLFTPSEWGPSYADMAGISFSSIQTIRGYILYLGFYLFIAVFAIVLIHRLLPKVRNHQPETFSFTLFLFLCSLGGFLGLYFIPIPIYPDRFLMFGGLFGFAPLSAAIFAFNRRLLKRIGIGLLAAFMLFNIYWIEPMAWDTAAEGVPDSALEEDYALAHTFDFSTGRIAGHPCTVMAIYDVHNNLGRRVFASSESEFNLAEFDYVIVQKEALELEQKYHAEPRAEAIAEMERLTEDGSPDRNKIYESNTLVAFKGSGTIFDYIEEVGGYEETNPVIPCGSSEDWDEHIREIGNILYEPGDTGKEYKTFYSGYQGGYVGNQVYLGYAYSSNGKSWIKHGKVIARSLEDPYVLKAAGTYYLYAEDKADVPFRNIRRYHSADCETWTDDGIVLQPQTGSWESQDVSSPLVWKEGDAWYMLYEGRERGDIGKVGLASSSDGVTWNKNQANPVFKPSGIEGDFDKDSVSPNDIVKIGSTYYLGYHGRGSTYHWGVAHSTNLTSWVRDNDYVIPDDNGQFVYSGTECVVYYTKSDDSGIYIGYPNKDVPDLQLEDKWTSESMGAGEGGQVAMADMNGDGHDDFVTIRGGVLWAINTTDGSTTIKKALGHWNACALDVGDIDGDDDYEIAVAGYEYEGTVETRNRCLRVLDHNGNEMWNKYLGSNVGEVMLVKIGELEPDTAGREIACYRDGCLYCYDRDGNELWHQDTGGTDSETLDGPVIGDFDGDGKNDIFVADDGTKGYAYRGKDGAKLWDFEMGGGGEDAWAVDLDDDERTDILVTTNAEAEHGKNRTGTPHIYAIKGDGTEYWSHGFPGRLDIEAVIVYTNPYTNELEIAMTGKRGIRTTVYYKDGTKKWETNVGSDSHRFSLAADDVNGDGIPEIVVDSQEGLDSKVWVFDIDGNKLCEKAIGGDGGRVRVKDRAIILVRFGQENHDIKAFKVEEND